MRLTHPPRRFASGDVAENRLGPVVATDDTRSDIISPTNTLREVGARSRTSKILLRAASHDLLHFVSGTKRVVPRRSSDRCKPIYQSLLFVVICLCCAKTAESLAVDPQRVDIVGWTVYEVLT